MKQLITLLLLTCTTSLFGEVWKGVMLEIRDITSPGIAVVYAGKNPISINDFTENDVTQIVDSIHRFKNIERKSLRVVSSGKATFEFKKGAGDSGLDLQTLVGVAPTPKETKQWIKKLRKAIETKNAEEICRLYFTGENGTNPDSEIPLPSGKKKMSDITKETIATASEVKITSRIKFYTGENFTMVCGENGNIELTIDGKKTFFAPIFISKKHSTAPIETL